MATSIIIDDSFEIPMDIGCLSDFRRWAESDAFPDRGRVDFVGGKIEVDMSPEDFFCHAKLKGVIFGRLFQKVERLDLGHLVTDRTRISSPQGDLSVEPDIVFISHSTLREGRARLVPKSGRPDRFVEVEEAPDLIAEIVSDSSVTKDTHHLPLAYAHAGVSEFWLADAQKEPLVFRIHRLVGQDYQVMQPGADGFVRSEAFDCLFRLDGERDARGHWKFDLVSRE